MMAAKRLEKSEGVFTLQQENKGLALLVLFFCDNDNTPEGLKQTSSSLQT